MLKTMHMLIFICDLRRSNPEVKLGQIRKIAKTRIIPMIFDGLKRNLACEDFFEHPMEKQSN